MRALACAGIGLVAGTAACTELRDQNDTCLTPGVECSSTDADEAVDSGRGSWSCLPLPNGGVPRGSGPPEPFTTALFTIDNGAVTSPPAGLQICECPAVGAQGYGNLIAPDASPLDDLVPCDPPPSPGTCLTVMPDGGPEAPISLTLPATEGPVSTGVFLSFVEPSPQYVPAALFFNQPPSKPLSEPALQVLSVSTAAGLGANLNSASNPFNPELAVIVLGIYDCNGAPASGIAVTLDEVVHSPLIPFTISYGGGAQTALGSGDMLTTGPSGQFGFANVLQGPKQAHILFPDGGQVAPAPNFYARYGWITGVDVRPN